MVSYKTISTINKKAYDLVTGRDNEVEFFIESIDDAIIIAIRGTETNATDVVRDLRLYPWYDKRVGWAHAGFLKGARVIEDEITEEILGHGANKAIYVSGHSLGGAIALLLGKILHYERFNVQEIVTFGAPRAVFGPSLGRFKHLKVTQFRNGSDLVTTLPNALFGYVHVNIVQIGEPFSKDLLSWTKYHGMKYYDELIDPHVTLMKNLA